MRPGVSAIVVTNFLQCLYILKSFNIFAVINNINIVRNQQFQHEKKNISNINNFINYGITFH